MNDSKYLLHVNNRIKTADSANGGFNSPNFRRRLRNFRRRGDCCGLNRLLRLSYLHLDDARKRRH